MKVSKISIELAKEMNQDDEDLRLCLTFLVCPKCGGELETAAFPSFKYVCKECTFVFTGEQEAALINREKKLIESYGNSRSM